MLWPIEDTLAYSKFLETAATIQDRAIEIEEHRVIRSAKKCPTVKTNGFSPFAFLAFILISINTVMNISNNISNNNNNNNNNDNDNNNNNLFNSNNVSERKRRLLEVVLGLNRTRLVTDLFKIIPCLKYELNLEVYQFN